MSDGIELQNLPPRRHSDPIPAESAARAKNRCARDTKSVPSVASLTPETLPPETTGSGLSDTETPVSSQARERDRSATTEHPNEELGATPDLPIPECPTRSPPDRPKETRKKRFGQRCAAWFQPSVRAHLPAAQSDETAAPKSIASDTESVQAVKHQKSPRPNQPRVFTDEWCLAHKDTFKSRYSTMMAASRKSIQGHGVIILNIGRLFNACTLILVAAAHWIMIVTSGMSGQFHFFDFATHLFIFALTILLFMTELGLPASFIAQRWPVFGEEAGFLVLGGLQIAMGCFTLADLDKPAYYVDNISLPLWRTILAAGILSIIFGFVSIIATFLFQDSKAHVSARMVRNNGLLARGADDDLYSAPSYHGSSISGRHEKGSVHSHQQPGSWARTAGKRLTQVFGRKPSGGNGSDGYDAQMHPASRDGGRSAYDNEEDVGIKPPAASIHPAYRRAGFDDGLNGNGHQHNDSGDNHRLTQYSLSSRIDRFSGPPPLPPASTMPPGPYGNLPGGQL